MKSDLYGAKVGKYFGALRMGAITRLPDRLGDILDVGGGNGTTSHYLIEHGRASSSVIVDPYHQGEDSETMTFLDDNADRFEVFDRFLAEGRRFDTILCLDVLEHLFDPWEVLKRLRPLLRPGGRIMVSLPNARFVALTVPLFFLGRFGYKKSGVMDKTHIRWFTRSSALEMVRGAGFVVERTDAHIDSRVRLVNLLTLTLFRRFFEYQYYIRAS